MLQALRPEDALAIAEVSRRRSRDEQAMAQYLGIGRGARANGAPPDGTPGDVDLAAFESEERRRLEAAIARLSPDARRELIALIWLVQRPLLSFEAALRRTRRITPSGTVVAEDIRDLQSWPAHVGGAYAAGSGLCLFLGRWCVPPSCAGGLSMAAIRPVATRV